MSTILDLLVAIAPLITTLGLKLIDIFVQNQDAKTAAQQEFLNAIQIHLNDAISSVEGRQSYDSQDQELDQMDKKHDTPDVPPAGKS